MGRLPQLYLGRSLLLQNPTLRGHHHLGLDQPPPSHEAPVRNWEIRHPPPICHLHLLCSVHCLHHPADAMLKTLIMMSGEIEYGEIFFKDNPPTGFGPDWDQDWEKVPFPFMTYSMFVIFFFSVSIVALNVLVGLTVDDIRNFLDNADLRKLT